MTITNNQSFYRSLSWRWNQCVSYQDWERLLNQLSGMKCLALFAGMDQELQDELELLWDVALFRMPLLPA